MQKVSKNFWHTCDSTYLWCAGLNQESASSLQIQLKLTAGYLSKVMSTAVRPEYKNYKKIVFLFWSYKQKMINFLLFECVWLSLTFELSGF